MKKVILAFSGGLDTSFSVPYLIEKGYEVITATIDTGGFSPQELEAIAQKSKQLGAIKHYCIDGKSRMFSQIVTYIIQSNGLYQGSYPNMCSDRYVIAQEVLKIAKKEKTKTVAHGSTAMGNDQVRFDVALVTLDPEVEIISPIKEIGGSRDVEQKYLSEKGFPVANLHKKYSVNQNILGVTYSGSEIDQLQEPDNDMFQWTNARIDSTEYLEIGFSNGVPISLNGKKMAGEELLAQLNVLVGSHGYGKGYYTGDCIIGLKGHIVFEAPGVLSLMVAHKALEQLTLTKSQQLIGQKMSQEFTDLVYSGKFFEPAVNDLKKFFDSQQQTVTGAVTVKLEANQVSAVAIRSPFSLINTDIAAYAQGCTWSAADADGFIKLYGLQARISAGVKKKIGKI